MKKHLTIALIAASAIAVGIPLGSASAADATGQQSTGAYWYAPGDYEHQTLFATWDGWSYRTINDIPGAPCNTRIAIQQDQIWGPPSAFPALLAPSTSPLRPVNSQHSFLTTPPCSTPTPTPTPTTTPTSTPTPKPTASDTPSPTPTPSTTPTAHTSSRHANCGSAKQLACTGLSTETAVGGSILATALLAAGVWGLIYRRRHCAEVTR